MKPISNNLQHQLELFLVKYYKNELLKGVFILIPSTSLFFLLSVTLDYYFAFNTTITTAITACFLLFSIYFIYVYLLNPILNILKYKKSITNEYAAEIIGKYFTNIKDKLLNTLHLQQLLNNESEKSDQLLLASVIQKTNELQFYNFKNAIQFSVNKKYLKYIVSVFVIFSFIWLLCPNVLIDGTYQFVHPQTKIIKKAPFTFHIKNKCLDVLYGENIDLLIELNGSNIPNELILNANGHEILMEKKKSNEFTYTIQQVYEDVKINFLGLNYKSEDYIIKVLPKPILIKQVAYITYPLYTGLKKEIKENEINFEVPEGTYISWDFYCKHTSTLIVNVDSASTIIPLKTKDFFNFSKHFYQNKFLNIKSINRFANKPIDSLNINVKAIKDEFPKIQITEDRDTTNNGLFFLYGNIKDDYGFHNLFFIYTIYFEDSLKQKAFKCYSHNILIDKSLVYQTFDYTFDINALKLQPGNTIEYYFEVSDNDAPHSFKKTKSTIKKIERPSDSLLKIKQGSENLLNKNNMANSITMSKKIEKSILEIDTKMNETNKVSWEEKKKIKELIEFQKIIQNKVEKFNQNPSNNNQSFTKSEALLEKEKQLQQLMDSILNPEIKKNLMELQKLLELNDKNFLKEKLDDIKLSNTEIEKELSKAYEVFKQIEIEQKLSDMFKKINDIKFQEQNLLNELTQNKNQNFDKTHETQLNISKQFNELKNDKAEIDKLNQKLENKKDLLLTKKHEEDISNKLNKASNALKNKNKKTAQEAQKESIEALSKMEDDLDKKLKEEEQTENEEDLQALRQIIENLLLLSFEQEKLIGSTKKILLDDPLYTEIGKTQIAFNEYFKLVEDSLHTLSKRNPIITATTNKNIENIKRTSKEILSLLEERKPIAAAFKMQYNMTSFNNLAVMLNISLEQSQKQAKEGKAKSNSSCKSGSCKKPGNNNGQGSGKPSKQSLKNMQEQLSKQIESLKKSLEQGKQNNGKEKGNNQNKGKGMAMQNINSNSEQFYKMAAQQQYIKNQLQKMMQSYTNKSGENSINHILDLMEQNEKDIVNKSISQETINRQNQILTKLLESDKADKEREQDEKRKSNEGDQTLKNTNHNKLNFEIKKEKEKEMIQSISPKYTPYYKEKIHNYFNSFSQ